METRSMTRTCFRRKIFCLLTFLIVWSVDGFAISENVSAGVVATLAISGDNVALGVPVAQGAEATLNVPNSFNLGSTTGLSTGASVSSQSTPNTGIVNFLGNSVVTGTMGAVPGQVLDHITGGAGGTTATFNGTVSSVFIGFTGASTMTFNATTSGALNFNTFNGTAVLGAGVTYSGAATTTAPNTGALTLNGASSYVGAIGSAPFFLNQISLNGNASIVGPIASHNIVVGANTLSQVGAVSFPVSATMTVRALSDAAFGSINAPGSAINFTTALQVNMLVDPGVILSGVPLQVVTGSGPGSAPITVTSNNPGFTFTGLNPVGTGNVLIFPTTVPPVPTVPINNRAMLLLLAMLLGLSGVLAVSRRSRQP